MVTRTSRKIEPGKLFFRPRLESLEDRVTPAISVTPLGGAVTPTDLVNSLLGGGVTASNIQFTGANSSAGLFAGAAPSVGIDSGVILSSGAAADVVGPNTVDDQTTSQGTPGDANLTAIAGNPTFDASVLEFDFVPQGDRISFNYIFGSEEYNEFVNAGVNDVFAFFLNGQNVALIPGTTTAVSIDTVNLGLNSQFYVNNALPTDPSPAPGPLRDTQMDGFTTVLTVSAGVNSGVVNHIKLAIADAGDSILDSNVMIQAGSFNSPRLVAYRPLRYAFRSLEQNLGQDGPTPVGGPATSATYDGLVTVVNVGNADLNAPVRIYFRNLPQGVTLENATGFDPTVNLPYIDTPTVFLPVGSTPLRIPVKLKNTNNASLGTFLVGPYDIDVAIAS